jgi:hypothetical protein
MSVESPEGISGFKEEKRLKFASLCQALGLLSFQNFNPDELLSSINYPIAGIFS